MALQRQVPARHEVFLAHRELVAGGLEQLFLERLDHVVVLGEISDLVTQKDARRALDGIHLQDGILRDFGKLVSPLFSQICH